MIAPGARLRDSASLAVQAQRPPADGLPSFSLPSQMPPLLWDSRDPLPTRPQEEWVWAGLAKGPKRPPPASLRDPSDRPKGFQ